MTYIETRLASSRKPMGLPDSTCHRKRPPPVKAAITTTHDVATQPQTTVYDLFRAQYKSPSQ